jgi:hypothetical protein
MGPLAGLDVVENREIPWSCWEVNLDSYLIQPITWLLYQLSYPGSLTYDVLKRTTKSKNIL